MYNLLNRKSVNCDLINHVLVIENNQRGFLMIKFFKRALDPISSYTHFWGAVVSSLTLPVFVLRYLFSENKNPLVLTACLIFGLSLTALYSASSIYHYFSGDDRVKRRLRKLDHTMIYVLIAGTYSPIAAAFMSPSNAVRFLIIIWGVAFLGIVIKLLWLNAPRFLSTLLYLLMGWALIFDIRSFREMPAGCLALIAAGGVAYSTGAVFYMLKKPNISPAWSFHEVFHLLIMAGSAFHFSAVLLFAF